MVKLLFLSVSSGGGGRRLKGGWVQKIIDVRFELVAG